MNIETIPHKPIALARTTSAVGDRDIGQKGSWYQRQNSHGKKKEPPEDEPIVENQPIDQTQQTIDIRV